MSIHALSVAGVVIQGVALQSSILARINTYLMRWIRKKYQRYRAQRKARAAWERVTTLYPRYFATGRGSGTR